MGSWTETCFITGTPIINTDDVYCIVCKKENFIEILAMMTDIQVCRGELNSYGEMENIKEQSDKGKYSVDEYHEKKKAVLFTTAEVFEKTLQYIDSKKDDFNEDRKKYMKLHPLVESTSKIFRFLNKMRHTYISNNEFSGMQNEECEGHEFLANQRLNEVKKLRAKHDESMAEIEIYKALAKSKVKKSSGI